MARHVIKLKSADIKRPLSAPVMGRFFLLFPIQRVDDTMVADKGNKTMFIGMSKPPFIVMGAVVAIIIIGAYLKSRK